MARRPILVAIVTAARCGVAQRAGTRRPRRGSARRVQAGTAPFATPTITWVPLTRAPPTLRRRSTATRACPARRRIRPRLDSLAALDVATAAYSGPPVAENGTTATSPGCGQRVPVATTADSPGLIVASTREPDGDRRGGRPGGRRRERHGERRRGQRSRGLSGVDSSVLHARWRRRMHHESRGRREVGYHQVRRTASTRSATSSPTAWGTSGSPRRRSRSRTSSRRLRGRPPSGAGCGSTGDVLRPGRPPTRRAPKRPDEARASSCRARRWSGAKVKVTLRWVEAHGGRSGARSSSSSTSGTRPRIRPTAAKSTTGSRPRSVLEMQPGQAAYAALFAYDPAERLAGGAARDHAPVALAAAPAHGQPS